MLAGGHLWHLPALYHQHLSALDRGIDNREMIGATTLANQNSKGDSTDKDQGFAIIERCVSYIG